MNGRDMAWRLGGLLALAAAGGASLLHRSVPATRVGGPVSSLDFVLGLCSFVVASLGVLLLVRGARLRDGWVRACTARRHARGGGDAPEPIAEDERAWTNAIAAYPCALAGGRVAITVFLADRANRAAAANRVTAFYPTNTGRQEIPRDRTRSTLRDPHLPLARRRGDRRSV